MDNIIDIFSGAGGLSEGFRNEKYNIVCHIEMDKSACDSLRTREAFHFLKKNQNIDIYNKYLENKITRQELYDFVPKHYLSKVINEKIGKDTIKKLFNKIDELLDGRTVDGIIGGPPCQAFSLVGRARNSKIKDIDERIYLYTYYLEFLKKYNPRYFIFENVKGLLSFRDINGKLLFPQIKDSFREMGYDIEDSIINSSEYGVSQNRERIFIFGHKDSNLKHYFFDKFMMFKEKPIIVKELFSDLPKLKADSTLNKYMDILGRKSNVLVDYYRKYNTPLTLNVARPHNERDLEIYRLVAEKKEKGINLKYCDLPNELQTHKNRLHFIDRYKCVDQYGYAHTVVAHISKDGHYYIHPDVEQNRSLTVREAARLQGFPDDYYFEGSRSDIFRQIGNAVPPLLSIKIAKAMEE